MRARFGTRGGVACLMGTVLGLILAGSGGATAAPDIPCGPASAHTLASDGLARVYSQHRRVYGCAAADQKRIRLGWVTGAGVKRVGPIALAGVDAAYGLSQSGVDNSSAEVVVRRLTDARVLHRQNAIAGGLPAESWEAVDAVVVKKDGSVAWTANSGGINASPKTQVEKADRTPRTLLDDRADIRTGSLRLRGSTLTWRDGRAKRSATLR